MSQSIAGIKKTDSHKSKKNFIVTVGKIIYNLKLFLSKEIFFTQYLQKHTLIASLF
jgi:hypothetical protein